jgi:hypothetical protein
MVARNDARLFTLLFEAGRLKCCPVKISIRRLILAACVAAAVICFQAPASRASQIGDDKWCAVTDTAGDAIVWDCEFDTAEDCAPAVAVGTRGFCALNPSYQAPQAPNPNAQH